MFRITTEDPLLKVKEITVEKEVVKEIQVLPESFAKLQEVDQLEAWMQSVGLEAVDAKQRTKEGILNHLRAIGRVK